jgi:hypothetical protein
MGLFQRQPEVRQQQPSQLPDQYWPEKVSNAVMSEKIDHWLLADRD